MVQDFTGNSNYSAARHRTAKFESPRGESDRMRLAALLFCLLLGGYGAHRFYAGKTGTAVLQLLLGLTSPLIWFVFMLGLGVLAPGGLEASIAPSKLLFGIIPFAMAGVVGVWVTIDLVLILSGGFKDADGRVISKWVN
jgi:hypothetical protein